MANQEVVAKGRSGSLSYFLGGLCFIGLCALVALAMYFFGDTGFWVAWGIIGFGVFPAICIYSIYLKSKEKNYQYCSKCNKWVPPLICATCGHPYCATCIGDHLCLKKAETLVPCEMCDKEEILHICVKCGIKLCFSCLITHADVEHGEVPPKEDLKRYYKERLLQKIKKIDPSADPFGMNKKIPSIYLRIGLVLALIVVIILISYFGFFLE